MDETIHKMGQSESLKEAVYIAAIISGCLVLMLGILSIAYGGGRLEINIVGITVNVLIAIVLFYGAKIKDTTHLVVWFYFASVQAIGLIIGMIYFIYQSEELLRLYPSKSAGLSLYHKTMEVMWKRRMVCIIYAVFLGLLLIFLLVISIIVKKFYDEIQCNVIRQSHGKYSLAL